MLRNWLLNSLVYLLLLEFLPNKTKLFLSNQQLWLNNLKEVEEYLFKNNKRPSLKDNNIEIKKLNMWISQQQSNYKNNKNIMLDKEIYNKWTEFINKYNKYFKK
jgi:hypothetical protein